MCLSGVMLSEIMKPRLQVQVMKWMLAVPTWREVGWASGEMVLLDFMRSLVSVFLSPSFTLFSVIRVFTSEMHVCIVKTVMRIRSKQDRTEVAVCCQQKAGWRQNELQSKRKQVQSAQDKKLSPMGPMGNSRMSWTLAIDSHSLESY